MDKPKDYESFITRSSRVDRANLDLNTAKFFIEQNFLLMFKRISIKT